MFCVQTAIAPSLWLFCLSGRSSCPLLYMYRNRFPASQLLFSLFLICWGMAPAPAVMTRNQPAIGRPKGTMSRSVQMPKVAFK